MALGLAALCLAAAAFQAPTTPRLALHRPQSPVAVWMSAPRDEPEPKLRQKLEGEAKALSFSWQTARLAIYTAFGIGALAGLSSTVPAMISGQPVDGSDGALGVAVDAVTLLAAAAGAVIDVQAQSQRTAKPAVVAASRAVLPDWVDAGDLRVQVRLSEREVKPVTLKELIMGARQTVVLLGGNQKFLRESLIAARFDGDLFRSTDVLLVPVQCDGSSSKVAGKSTADEAFERMMAAEANVASSAPSKGKTGGEGKKGFGKGIASSTWTAAPYVAEVLSEDASEWVRRMQVEADSAAAQGADPEKGVVIVLGRDGIVSQRRVGTPTWRQFLIELRPAKFDAEERRKTARQ